MQPESAKKVGHSAPFPVELPYRLILLFTFSGDIVLDPFMGSGSTAIAALKAGRKYVGYESEAEYVKLAQERLASANQVQGTSKVPCTWNPILL